MCKIEYVYSLKLTWHSINHATSTLWGCVACGNECMCNKTGSTTVYKITTEERHRMPWMCPGHFLKKSGNNVIPILCIFRNVFLCTWVKLIVFAGILFSTLVFGPACGFILGSVCTKFYVDAIFIDTSEYSTLFFIHVHVLVPLTAVCPQVNWISLLKTQAGLEPGGRASSCAVPYSSARLSQCSASLSRSRKRRERRRSKPSRSCFLLPSTQTMRLQSPATELCAAWSLPTTPPAVSNSGVSYNIQQCEIFIWKKNDITMIEIYIFTHIILCI